MRFLASHVLHFFIMGMGIALVLGLLHPTMRPERTRASILKHAVGLLGIGLVLAWLMYLLPRHPVRF
jgi:MFS superfamily sulfate permease-like transporter